MFFLLIGFIFCFILRDFVPIPSENNVFVALQLGFSLVKFIGNGQNFTGSGPRRALRHSVLCSVLCRLFRSVVSFITKYTNLEEVFLINFLDFKKYCFSLYIGNLFETILQRFYLSFQQLYCTFHFVAILITSTILNFLFELVRRRFVKSRNIT